MLPHHNRAHIVTSMAAALGCMPTRVLREPAHLAFFAYFSGNMTAARGLI